MIIPASQKQDIDTRGFTIVEGLFSEDEIAAIARVIDAADTSKPEFRKTDGLFAIRQFLMVVPEAILLIFSTRLVAFLKDWFGDGYFVTKSIYFDKPEGSNWFVAYHQDLTISVSSKMETEGFSCWTVKQGHYAVQPPMALLERNFTLRIHLDDTDENNGALKVVPGSHLSGVYRPETIDWDRETEAVCQVKRGGVMIMKPLLLHASGRTTNSQKRRVIHIEFSNQQLPGALQWAEQYLY